MVDDEQVTSTEDKKDKTMGTSTSVDAVMKCMKAGALLKDNERAQRYVSIVRSAMALERFVRATTEVEPRQVVGTKDEGMVKPATDGETKERRMTP
ncbi:uncharacterized protein PITG_17317 [Phytophthora infestans T30-4]|uniref:Uncharacterized protein n=1 Tax=Phytophthora infestans (strain T30-4) TaxID=403677 RepID=D0NVS8_PHYIT|nr:uncharacterized protein PITG_17317 [Phytophthora infestans T30-4]EEY66759.1 hypothetical protein PITG_17317 [Phytophthora infestans T30-4]|eukprot:XP_002896824.1 hypothetical protein PITG_17317 [Phytophthora infestans T30-4]